MLESDLRDANDLIGMLRQAAVGIKALGDEVLNLRDVNEGLLADLDKAASDEANARSKLADWTELLDDFRLGIRDRDELIERTIGR